MIVEINGGTGGFKEYLVNGQKKGRGLHRDQLDQRIPLFGDLDIFEVATSLYGDDGIKYDHVTLSFSENHVSDEMLQIAVNGFREHYLAAWPESERHRVAFYAEAHRPKILTYINSETGEEITRRTHIHIGIGRHDLATGESIEPLGYLGPESDNLKYVDAWQESFNAKHGFSSPKDNPKITPKNAIDILASYTGMKPDALGTFGERKAHLELELMRQVVSEEITTWADFERLLAQHGTVSKMYKGKFNECYRVKFTGLDENGKPHKAMRLQGNFFQRGFIERSTEDKIAIFEEKAREAYLEQMQPRKEPGYVAGILVEWNTIKAREHRYLHTGSAEFAKYQAGFTSGLTEFDASARDRRLALANALRAERTQALAGLSGAARQVVADKESARAKDAKAQLKTELRIERRTIASKQPIDAEKRLQLLDDIERVKNEIASPDAVKDRKIAAARDRVPRMPVRNLDGISSRSEMLLRDHASVDVRTESAAEPDGPGVRQTDGGGRDRGEHAHASQGGQPSARVNQLGPGAGPSESGSGPGRLGGDADQESGTGHVLVEQPSSVLARLHVEMRERYEQAADNERYAEIRQHLDCAQLLSGLSHTHGLNPALYQVATAKDGTPRIQCGTRVLSPSDFLTKELGLPWAEAAPILRATYENQIEHKRTTPRIEKAAPSQLWRDFKAGTAASKDTLKLQLKSFDGETTRRRSLLVAVLKNEQIKALDGLSGADKKAEKSLQKLRAATAKAEFKDERKAARVAMQAVDASAWRVFLHARAQAGNEEALAVLRKLDGEARAAPAQSITGTIVLDDDADDAKRRRRSTSLILKTLTHFVERNGDITYRQDGHVVLRDEGQHLAVLDENSEEAIAAALLLGREKFGTNLTLTGSPEFQRRVVAVAVAQGIAVRFVDPQLDAIRQQLADDKYTTMRAPAQPAQQSPAKGASPSNKSAQRAVDVGVPAVDPHHQVAPAPTPAQPTVTTKAKKTRKPAPVVAETPLTDVHQVAPLPEPITAKAWLTNWAEQSRKAIGAAIPETGATTHTVVYVAPDGIVVNKGRSGAVYPVPTGLVLHAGDKVVVDRNGELCLSRTPEQGVGKNAQSR
ncbi:LPD7 domain-containing protein [Massilia scottii]|uniref:LPD7 domain-containing protein n=1 Tax=Massilia scottii TaxID=3057166 RepID=UPI0027964793|nr:LPD7 domain-containing protein [Massilia sp. CCM 9029]MDQ1835204.1 LPD7 domain-containing protein [Massilia sp. CCM 9029]